MRMVQIVAVQIAAALLTLLGSTVLFLSFQADLIRFLVLTVEDRNRALCLGGSDGIDRCAEALPLAIRSLGDRNTEYSCRWVSYPQCGEPIPTLGNRRENDGYRSFCTSVGPCGFGSTDFSGCVYPRLFVSSQPANKYL